MFLSIDIGGTTIKYGIVNRQGNILKKSAVKTEDNKEIFLASLLTIYHEVKKDYEIEGIGISAPGIIEKNGHMTTAGAIMSLYGENIKAFLEENTHLPVTIDNDANAAAIAEKWLGNATNMKNYICLVLGTGMGGGIVINNEVYSGANGMAGEIGWGIISGIPETGLIEDYSLNRKAAVVSGLCQNYNTEKRKTDTNHEDILDAKEIFNREKDGEELARTIVNQFYEDLVGGGISQNKEFQERLQTNENELKKRHEALNRILPVIDTPIIMAKLKNDAGMLGATYQIKQKIDNN
jgi:predicted NBD/HSP70 family sugar kinase